MMHNFSNKDKGRRELPAVLSLLVLELYTNPIYSTYVVERRIVI